MASLSSLVIELQANTARLSGDLGRAVAMAEGASRKMSAAAGLASKAFSAIPGVLAGFTLIGAIKESIEFGDAINKAAIKAGIGGQAMSELAFAAKQADIDIASLSTGLKKMQIELSTAQASGIKAGSALDALGLTLTQLKGLSADQQFALIGDRISKLADPADRTRAAVELFGKAGSDLLPLFSEGAEGIRKAREEAQRLGISLSGEAVTKIDEADDAIKRLKGSWQGFATTLTATAAPAITTVLDTLVGKNNDAIADFISKVGLYQAGLGQEAEALDAANQVKGPLRRNSAFDAAPGYKDPEALKKAIEAAAKYRQQLDQLTGVTVDTKNTTLDLWQSTQTRIEKTSASIEAQIAALRVLGDTGVISLDEFRNRMDDILEPLQEFTPTVRKKAIPALNDLSEFAKQAASNIQDSFAQFLFDPFKGGLRGMLSSFVTTLRQMIAQAASAQILKSIFGGGSGGSGGGLGSFLSGFGKFLGFANGGSFQVGGSGGTDSQLVAFRASPDERVSITKPGQGNGGGATLHVYNSTTINGTGVPAEQLVQILQQRDRAFMERLQQSYSRSNMRSPVFV